MHEKNKKFKSSAFFTWIRLNIKIKFVNYIIIDGQLY
jgi:hypothetical protein